MNNNLSNIKKSKYFLNKGECIAIPTETVYGLAANAYSNVATSKIFKLKKRPKTNPLIVHYASLKMLEKDCDLNKNFFKLFKKFSPGPITFVLKLKKNSKISKNVTNNKKTLAVRFPKHSLTRKLLRILKYPLAAPSANISTKISPVSEEDVKDEAESADTVEVVAPITDGLPENEESIQEEEKLNQKDADEKDAESIEE